MVIDHDGVKRELKLPLQMCLNRDEFWAIYTALETIVQREREGHPWVYGWIDMPLSAKHTVNTTPLDWKESAK